MLVSLRGVTRCVGNTCVYAGEECVCVGHTNVSAGDSLRCVCLAIHADFIRAQLQFSFGLRFQNTIRKQIQVKTPVRAISRLKVAVLTSS
jgi:hypothetical protein